MQKLHKQNDVPLEKKNSNSISSQLDIDFYHKIAYARNAMSNDHNPCEQTCY